MRLGRVSLAGYGAGILIIGALIAALSRTRAGLAFALVLGAGALLLRLLAWKRRRPFRFELTPGGLLWTDPVKGPRELAWRDVGAIAVRESPAAGEEGTVLYVVPREREMGTGCALAVRDLARTTDEGVRRLRAAAADILPRLPADVIIDRASRVSLLRWGIKIRVS